MCVCVYVYVCIYIYVVATKVVSSGVVWQPGIMKAFSSVVYGCASIRG